jgi:hypothetical protein
MRYARILTPLLLLFLWSRIAGAQPNPVSGNVLLRGSNAPAARAVVDFTGPQRARAVTIDDGTFYISNLAPGTYTMTITYQGNAKKPFSVAVSVKASLTFYIDP